MSTPTSVSAPDVRDNFDAGSLSWVMSEIRDALGKSKAAMVDAVAQEAEVRSTSLRHAKTYLHQADGALQIVDIDGVAIITETTEDLLERIESGQVALNTETVQVIDNAFQALIEYLEELLSGGAHQPVRLFPYYQALLQLRGAERIHPADLFFPDLALRPNLPAIDSETAPLDYLQLRKRFEQALLPFLKRSDLASSASGADGMLAIIAEIEKGQVNAQSRAFWWVLHGFAEAVTAGQIPAELYIKQLFARINLQIRRLSEGSQSIAERLLRDALFFIARIAEPSPLASQIRATYQLNGTVPSDYSNRRYGQVDATALHIAKEKLNQAKIFWNRIAGGDPSVAPQYEAEMRELTESGASLGAPALARLLRELNGIARHAANSLPGDRLGLEMATSLLFVENALTNIGRLDENFASRAEALTARLLSIVAGEEPQDSSEWLDDMSRQAQQRQTMSVLAAEMQASLRQVEKTLEEYFREPTDRTHLPLIGPILHQIGGALAVLDQDDAMQAVLHTQVAVQAFIDAPEKADPDISGFKAVAQNIGALSFFIETLQVRPDAVNGRFTFDQAQGVFRANLIEKKLAPEHATAHDATGTTSTAHGIAQADHNAENAEHLFPELPTVEDDMRRHQQRSADLAVSLTAQPDDIVLREQLRESLQQVRRDATLLDNPEANERAKAAIDLLAQPDATGSHAALADIVSATASPVEETEVISAAAAPSSDEEVDAELLEIFLTEADEVLTLVRQTVPESRSDPHNTVPLTTLRRAFHTLKGSGRMVGLNALGEAAWSIEQVLNMRLSDGQGGSANLFALLDRATELLTAWVIDLQTTGRSSRTAQALVDSAARIMHGEPFSMPEPPLPSAVIGLSAPSISAVVEAQEQAADAAEEIVAQAVVPSLNTLTPPVELDAFVLHDDGTNLAPPLPVEPELQLGEGDVTPLTDTTIPTDASPHTDSTPYADSSFQEHMMPAFVLDSLNVKDTAPPKLATTQREEIKLSAAEMALFAAIPTATPLITPVSKLTESPPVVDTAAVLDFPTTRSAGRLDDNVKRIGSLEISVPLHNIYLAETDDLVRMLAQDIAEWRHEPERPVSIAAVHAAHSLAGSSATVGFNALQEVAHGLEKILQLLARNPIPLTPADYDVLEHCVALLKSMLQEFALGDLPLYEPAQVNILTELQNDLESRAALPVAHPTAPQMQMVDPIEPLIVPVILPPVDHTEPVLAAIPAAVPPAAPVAVERATAFAEPVFSNPNDQVSERTLLLKDELDPDLLPIFLEEGRDMLPQMGEALRSWQQNLSSASLPQSVLRLLHTIKGSARMAGAMRLGQHMHETESRIELMLRNGAPDNDALDELLGRHDHGLQMFEQLQNPQAAVPAQQSTPIASAAGFSGQENSPQMRQTDVRADEAGNEAAVAVPFAGADRRNRDRERPEPLAVATPGNVPLVRVRADILDRLVNQAGEVSISRSKLETEVGTLRQSLGELTDNVARLRDQLREIEMQAETQINSRVSASGDREFDPLEFDRFTRLQEITRMMAESVSDVASVQHNLARTVDGASAGLITQARLTRDLQQDLMRVRMIQFASISERLYRVTRQASKEVDKRVNLDIRGSAVEIDRSVLERMAGPFEHLLRNAIVHGIESREQRRAGVASTPAYASSGGRPASLLLPEKRNALASLHLAVAG